MTRFALADIAHGAIPVLADPVTLITHAEPGLIGAAAGFAREYP